VCVCVCVCLCFHTNCVCFTHKSLNTLYTHSEADWLTRSRDSRCAEASKTQPPSFVSVTAKPVYLKRRSRGSSVSIVSDYRLDDRGSIPDRSRGFLLQPLRPDQLWGPQSLLYNGYRGKARPGRDADHSPPSSAEVKSE
jgi:hypothetical protein